MNNYFIQNIDYSSNKNYSDVNVDKIFSEEDNAVINKHISNIDALIENLTCNKTTNAVEVFCSVAYKHVELITALINKRAKNDREVLNILQTITDKAFEHCKKYVDNLSNNKAATPGGLKAKDDFESLVCNGYVEYQLPNSDFFNKWAANQLQTARDKYKDLEDWRGANSYNADTAEVSFIKNIIKEFNIIESLSAYKGMEMEYFYAAWDYSNGRQKWFRNNHDYNYISPTNYYHFDADEDVAKMLIYLTDVNLGDGPFKFVSGSNKMERSIFKTYIAYTIDSVISPMFNRKDNLYGRGLFLYKKDLLLKFPKPFMGTTHFGDDLENDSLVSKYLLENTVTFDRNKGAMILFDGYKGVHAGGNATTGERLAVQIAFKRKAPSSLGSIIKQKVYKITGR